MPPRFAYWTLLIDNGPTEFRAARQDDLLPTLYQLRRTNANVVMKWFAHGRLWDSPDDARDRGTRGSRHAPRGKDWRPGGEHRDPRARPVTSKRDRRQHVRVRPALEHRGRAEGAGRSERPSAPRADRPIESRRRRDRFTSRPTSDGPRHDGNRRSRNRTPGKPPRRR